MIRAVIIDDEKLFRDDIRQKIELLYNDTIDIVGESDGVSKAIALINELNPDLLFLDVEINEGTSFDILNRLKVTDFQIIFITGFNEHAIKAIKVGALDYLLKPIDQDEFIEAVDKYLATEKTDIKDLIKVTKDYFNGISDSKIVLRTMDTYYKLDKDDILYCKADKNYTTFVLRSNEQIVMSKPIKYVQELLGNSFVRCHQSYLVNKNHVIRYRKQGYLVISKEHQIPVSSRMKDETLKRIF